MQRCNVRRAMIQRLQVRTRGWWMQRQWISVMPFILVHRLQCRYLCMCMCMGKRLKSKTSLATQVEGGHAGEQRRLLGHDCIIVTIAWGGWACCGSGKRPRRAILCIRPGVDIHNMRVALNRAAPRTVAHNCIFGGVIKTTLIDQRDRVPDVAHRPSICQSGHRTRHSTAIGPHGRALHSHIQLLQRVADGALALAPRSDFGQAGKAADQPLLEVVHHWLVFLHERCCKVFERRRWAPGLRGGVTRHAHFDKHCG
mmetsp:Transcript_10148/g.31997  ORF Transcript_10148/g.31997 Transcript_10148/m.31997 type:complete len:255 (-) Transcript_10148:919-1683(-)